MKKDNKIKIFIGLFYLTLVGLFLYYLFTNFTFQQLTSYDFIKDNVEFFSELKKTNLILLSLSFLAITILWVFPFLGFGSPILIFSGIIFGQWLGTIISVFSISIGALTLYIIG